MTMETELLREKIARLVAAGSTLRLGKAEPCLGAATSRSDPAFLFGATLLVLALRLHGRHRESAPVADVS